MSDKTGMSAKKYQEVIEKFAIYPKAFALEYTSLGLVSEAGEVAGKVKKMVRGDYTEVSEPDADGRTHMRVAVADFEEDLHKELGDVLWYVARLCKETGTTMERVMADNVAKLNKRLKENTLQGSGDNR